MEGGVRVPFIARYPHLIPAGQVTQGVASMMDMLPTLAQLTGASLPSNPLDGVDILPLLTGEKDSVPRDLLLYFDSWNIQCARSGPWKLHVARYDSPPWIPGDHANLPLPRPELYNLDADPEESYNVAADYPQVVSDLRSRLEAMLPGLPGQVMSAWQNTMSIAVQDTPDGALPIRK